MLFEPKIEPCFAVYFKEYSSKRYILVEEGKGGINGGGKRPDFGW